MVIARRIATGLGILGLALWIYIARELRAYGETSSGAWGRIR